MSHDSSNMAVENILGAKFYCPYTSNALLQENILFFNWEVGWEVVTLY